MLGILLPFLQPHYGAGVDSASNRNLPGGKGRLARKADLTAICEPTL
jgi:hypothetical protein